MITLLNDAPENVAAFNASGEINQEDFENIVIPHVKNKVEKFDELNYLLYLNTSESDTDTDAWLTHTLSNLNDITPYNRAAIISDDAGLKKVNGLTARGNFKVFPKDSVYHAMYWCNNGNEPQIPEN